MVDNTPNHGLHKYAQGDQDWTHSPDMQTIEERLVIRDAEGNLQNYTPHAAATFVATDTGAVYDGTGDSWMAASRGFEKVATNSVEAAKVTATESITYPDGTEVTSSPNGDGGKPSVTGELSAGQFVGVSAGSIIYAEDPRDHSDHAAAIQAVADVVGNDGGGYVYIPAVPADSSQDIGVEIPRTIEMGNHTGNGPVMPIGWGFARNGPYITPTFNDGSPTFYLEGRAVVEGMSFGNLLINGPGVDAEAIRFGENFTGYHLKNVAVHGLGTPSPQAEGAYVWESGSNNATHTNLRYNQRGANGENPDVSGMNVYAFRDTQGGRSPSEHMFRGCNTYADPGNPFNNLVDIGDSGASQLLFSNCRFEGSGGDAHIAGSTGAVTVIGCEMARTEQNANAVDFTGFKFSYIGNDAADTQDGDHIRVAPKRVVIGAFKAYANGDDIVVTGPPGGGNVPQVPSRDVLRGSVTYPSGLEEVQTKTT